MTLFLEESNSITERHKILWSSYRCLLFTAAIGRLVLEVQLLCYLLTSLELSTTR